MRDEPNPSEDPLNGLSQDRVETVEITPDEKEMPDWVTETDKEILEVLGTELILTPSIIAENIERSREGVSQRLNALQAGELVEKIDRGKYKITSEGFDLVSTTYTTVIKDSEFVEE